MRNLGCIAAGKAIEEAIEKVLDAELNLVVCIITEGIPQHGMKVTLFCHNHPDKMLNLGCNAAGKAIEEAPGTELNLIVCITEGILPHAMNVTLFCHIMLIRRAIFVATLQDRL